MNIEFKKLTIRDLAALMDISISTYRDTFSSGNSKENMTTYLSGAFNTKQLTTELNEVQSEFYFFYFNNRLAGYIKLNSGTAQTEIIRKETLELHRIYVLQDFQGKNIGQFVLDKVIRIAQEKKMRYLWLGVWEKNEKAIKFYTKNKFVVFDTHEFRMGTEIQTDFLMKLNLK